MIQHRGHDARALTPMRRAVLPAAILVTLVGGLHAQTGAAPAASPETLINPLLASGPDPWVIYREGYYYYISSGGGGLNLRKTRALGELRNAAVKTIWRPPQAGPYSREIWAPELHFLRGKWYVYFAADAGTNQSHRLWVIENPSPDPTEGEWTFKGKVADPSDKWAIDGTVFESRGRMYLAWSGWEGDVNGVQSIYLAELENPWTVKGRRVRVSAPEYPWEKIGDLIGKRNPENNPGANLQDPLHVDVNEGPAVLQRNGRVFLIYSSGGCWTDYYGLGMLTALESSNLLDPASWKKSSVPVFWQSPAAHAYGPGHNSFFKSPDGTQDWILYHANPEPNQGCGGRRSPRAQPFTWRPDGAPDFDRPLPIGSPIPKPSGEREGDGLKLPATRPDGGVVEGRLNGADLRGTAKHGDQKLKWASRRAPPRAGSLLATRNSDHLRGREIAEALEFLAGRVLPQRTGWPREGIGSKMNRRRWPEAAAARVFSEARG